MSKEFWMEMMNYERLVESYVKDFASRHYNSILFAAQQLLYSDDYVIKKHISFISPQLASKDTCIATRT